MGVSEIKGRHVIVMGAGPSLRNYKGKIEKFIKDNDVIIFGCNYITHLFIPDYHFWGSAKRWRKYGHLMDKKSRLVVSDKFPKKIIREKWKGKYITFKNVEREWKPGSEDVSSREFKRCKVFYQNGKMFGCVRERFSVLQIFLLGKRYSAP